MVHYDKRDNEKLEFPSFYQIEGVQFLIDKKRVLIADEMGVGKTAQAIAGKIELENRNKRKMKTLVVAPNSLKSYWQRKIEEYTTRPQRVVRLDDYSDESLSHMRYADFVIVNYDVFSIGKRSKILTERLLKENFKYVVLDEVHNIKNPNALRSDKIRAVANKAEYLSLLSGTPIPNNLTDTYMLISLLEKDRYESAEKVRQAHWDQPRIIRAILQTKRLKREMKDIVKLPKIRTTNISIDLQTKNPTQKQVYDQIYNNDELTAFKKLQELRKTLLDPSLVSPDLIYDLELRKRLAEIPSEKYRALDDIIKEKADKGEKTIVFSTQYKRNVTERLQWRYKEYGALKLDGDVHNSERDRVIEEFQTNPEKKVLIATTAVAGEGISLTAAKNVVFLDFPYTPAEVDQAIKRVHRRGQTKEIDVYNLIATNSIDEGVLELLQLKREGIDFIEKGRELKPEHIQALIHHFRSSPIMRRLYTPQQRIKLYSSRMVDRGSQIIRHALVRNNYRIARDYAEHYWQGWEDSYSANTARVYKQIIESIGKKINLKKKVDLGSGPGIVSKVLDARTTNIELNEVHFKQPFADKRNGNILGTINSLPLRNSLYDLVVMSLSLYYTSNDVKRRNEASERETALREANRILRKGGYLITTLPHHVVDQNVAINIDRGLQRIGFKTIPELTGFVRTPKESFVDFQVYISVTKKMKKPLKRRSSRDFIWSAKESQTYTQQNRGIATEFILADSEGKTETLDNRIKKYLKRI